MNSRIQHESDDESLHKLDGGAFQKTCRSSGAEKSGARTAFLQTSRSSGAGAWLRNLGQAGNQNIERPTSNIEHRMNGLRAALLIWDFELDVSLVFGIWNLMF
ncbi:MAG: hypothetical protein L0Z50_14620 [Verrucomicrobiales bacterium]|nr:hypothetical protein [Verrucomicrobiales bacterium]